jgi:HlyD family secretion protein
MEGRPEMKSRELLTAGSWTPRSTLLLLVALLFGCQEKSQQSFQGYAEGEYVMVASPLAGRLERLAVTRGAQVEAGDLLFRLDSEPQLAERAAAVEEVRRAESRLADLRKGQRSSELEMLRSRLEQVQAALQLSRKEFARRQELFAQQIISGEELDRARTALERDQSAVAEFEAQLETARLGARTDAVAAALAEVATARAGLAQADWSLMQKSQSAAEDALVFDTLFEPGEFVPAGYPVVSLLPPGNIKLRFFVPEPLVGTLRLGQQLAITFDGSGGSLAAAVSYISPRAEYTPPVIFSRETRAKLVFMVEARPAPNLAVRLHPGQPIEVQLEATHE